MSIGQRFQVITNNEGSFKIYRAQWLWGSYAIRRLGTAVRNFLRHNSNGYRGFEEFLKGYCFLSHADLTVQSAVEYLSSYDRIEGFTKCQEKEFVDGLKTFAKLTVITPPRWVRAKRE